MQTEPFSQTTEYLELNRRFVQSLRPHLRSLDCVVDLACGDGLLTSLLLAERLVNGPAHPGPGRRRPALIGLDLARPALVRARDRTPMLAVQASVDCLPLASETVDLVLLGNAVHCFAAKEQLFREVRRLLRPAGVFAFNSAFYAGSIVQGTEEFYGEWMKQAVRYIQAWERENQAPGMRAAARMRDRRRRAFSNRWLTPGEYQQALGAQGFQVERLEERRLDLRWSHFAGFGDARGTWERELAAVLLSGYPVDLACEALTAAARPAFATLGVEAVPRAWLEVTCVRR